MPCVRQHDNCHCVAGGAACEGVAPLMMVSASIGEFVQQAQKNPKRAGDVHQLYEQQRLPPNQPSQAGNTDFRLN